MQKTKVSACIVVYGNAHEAAAAARSLEEHTKDTELTLTLVDNASPDGAGAVLAAQFSGSDINVICLPENVGFGRGHNAVLSGLKSKYHCVVNPDITLGEDAVSKLCSWMDEHPDVVMATPQLLYPDGRKQYTGKRIPGLLPLIARQISLPFLKNVEKHYLMLDEDLTKPQEIQFCTGSFFIMRTDIFKKIGGFDKDYFMYVEDADITRRAMQYGKVMFVPETYVYHAWHRDPKHKWKNFRMQVRSMFLYWHKWGFKFI